MIRAAFCRTLLLAGLAGWLGSGCVPDTPDPALPPPDTNPTNFAALWPPDRISREPEAYLQFVDQTIQRRTEERQQKLVAAQQRREQINQQHADFSRRLAAVENLLKRFETAAQRADDEDRWPVVVAGRQFDKARTEAIMATIRRHVSDNAPLVAAYRDAIRRLDMTDQVLRSDIENLKRLRAKVQIDRERVKLNQGMAEFAELKKTEAELASFSQTLVDMGDDLNAGALAAEQAAQQELDLDTLLK